MAQQEPRSIEAAPITPSQTPSQAAGETLDDVRAYEAGAPARTIIFFGLSLFLMVLLGFVLPHGGVSDIFSFLIVTQQWPITLLIALWLIIVVDSVIGVFQSEQPLKARLSKLLLLTILPIFRLTQSTAQTNSSVWLPRFGNIPVNRNNFDQVEMALALPMLFITLLILPVVAGELFFHEQVAQSAPLALALHTVTALIWFAFVWEFVVLVSFAEKKLDYCKKNWINVVIILLPLASFLSKLQVLRFLRLTKASKLLRAYRLRGVFARALRLALMLNIIERLMQRNVDKYIAHLEEKIHEKNSELEELNAKLSDAKQRLKERDAKIH